jgi:hypothetical protein
MGAGLSERQSPEYHLPLPGVEIDTPNSEGRMFALALLKGYPNTTIIVLYVVASAIFVLAMYRYHRSQI